MSNRTNPQPRVKLLLLAATLLIVSLACRSLAPLSQAAPAPTAIVATAAPVIVQRPDVQVVGSEEQVLASLYALVNPSVVNITLYAAGPNGVMLPFSQGSGFVYDANRHIVTNAHVVEGADQIDVIFYDGTIRPAEVVGSDPHSDLAVIQVEEVPAGINPLPLGRMEDLAVGQTVVAIGNPFGYAGTLTRGIISALGRTIPALTAFSIPASIQTDAAINPGNSGGPLLNLRGEVIGINDQIETADGTRANSGVGFAIPVSVIAKVVPVLIEEGKYEWSWLGVRGGTPDLALVRAMNLPVEKGAYLWQITDGGPADKAGLKGANETITYNGRQVDVGGDLVTAIDGQPVSSFDDLLVYIALQTSPGQQVTLTILRDGKYQDVKVTLGVRPDSVQQ